MRRKGFSLTETVLSSVVVLIVVASLTISAGYFLSERTSTEDRRDALILAEVTMTDYEEMDNLPADGTYRIDSIPATNNFTVVTSIKSLITSCHEIRVVVTTDSGEQVELVRRIYRGTNEGVYDYI